MTTPVFPDPPAPTLRFRGRHVQQTIMTYLEQQMDRLGWVTPPVNLGGTPMTFMEFPPDERSTKSDIPGNRLAISLGNEPEELDEQLGGGLYSVSWPLYVDIYGESYSGSRSIGADVKDVLTRQVLPVYNFAASPPVVLYGAWIEFSEVAGPRAPDVDTVGDGFRKYWRVVTATALTTFSEPPA